MTVEIDKRGIGRQLRSLEIAFVRLRSAMDPDEAAVVFERVLSRCSIDGDRPDFGAMVTPRGPVTVVEEADRPEVWEWLDEVSAGLSAEGVSGSIGAASSAKAPQVFPEGRVPTAGLQFASEELPAPDDFRWPLSPAETRRMVAHAARWCELGGEQWLGLNFSFWLPGTSARDLAPAMAAAVASVDTSLVASRGQEGRWVATQGAEWGAQVVSSELTWVDRVDLCRQALLWEPQLLSWGIVGTTWHPLPGSMVDPVGPRLVASAEAFRLRTTLVRAVQGIQLLTGSHLARAHDLAAWKVTEVASDRFLVEARDLAPWFTGDKPHPDLYAQAIRDFGSMLITYETAAEFGVKTRDQA